MNPMMILETKSLKKSYTLSSDRLEVLKGLDLKVKAGEFLAVAGPSGAGKSTLLHILGGLDKPSEGEVLIEQEDIYRMRDKDLALMRNKKIGFIFQFYHLLPEFTALENVLMPALIYGPAESFSVLQARAGELLARVGLGQRMRHRPNELSGGEQQRVAIARSLMNQPKILLCDEPTGNLDSERGGEIIELLEDLNGNKKLTLIIVTHDQEIARRARRTIHMRDGSFVDG